MLSLDVWFCCRKGRRHPSVKQAGSRLGEGIPLMHLSGRHPTLRPQSKSHAPGHPRIPMEIYILVKRLTCGQCLLSIAQGFLMAFSKKARGLKKQKQQLKFRPGNNRNRRMTHTLRSVLPYSTIYMLLEFFFLMF